MAIKKTLTSIRKISKKYIAILRANHIDLDQVFLFGSFVKGKQNIYSDIDIAIVSGSLTGDRYDDRCHLMHLRQDVDLRIEPHPFRPEDFVEDNPEAAEIMRTGVRIL